MNLAKQFCNCIPWDYIFNKAERFNECDVFGRTCFWKSMKQFSISQYDNCPMCKPECDFIRFEKIITEKEMLVIHGISGGKYYNRQLSNQPLSSKVELYLKCNSIPSEYFGNELRIKITGNKVFVNFLSDKNQTILDQGLRNAIKALIDGTANGQFEEDYPVTKYQDLLIVHLRFLQPRINIVDTKYTLTDIIAGFGGKFGIFAQLTGWSFLGILNLLILIIKIFPFYKKD